MNAPKPATQSSTTKTILPEWYKQAGQENYEIIKGITGQEYKPYQGPLVANQSNMTTQGYDWLTKNIGVADPLYQQAQGVLSEGYANSGLLYGKGTEALDRAAGMDIQGQTNPFFQNAAYYLDQAGQPIDINKWLNPYRGEVEANAMRNLSESLTQSQMANADKAASSNAFGGSRQGIEAAVTAAEGAKKAGDLSAQLRQQGWDTATANAFADAQRQLNVGLGFGTTGSQLGRLLLDEQGNLINTGTGFFAGGKALGDTAISTASGLEGLGRTKAGTAMTEAAALIAAGGNEEAYNQKQIDADKAEYEKAQAYPLEMANARLAALGLTPHETTEKTKTTGTSESKGTDWASTILGGAQLLFGLSDRDDKTDIQKLGKDDESGLDMYAYRYKGDPKTYPKVVGPMAQDVKKKYPGKVKKVAGHLGILANG